MTVSLSPVPEFRSWDNNGNPLAGGQLFTYVAGTSTPQATYIDSTQTTQNTNPVILNYRGEASVWLDPTLTYKLVLTDSLGNLIWSQDQIQGPIGQATVVALINSIVTQSFIGLLTYPKTPGETTAGVTPINYWYPPGHAWRYLTTAQITDAINFTLSVDQTTNLQNWLNAAWASNVAAYLPGGGYLISSTLIIDKQSSGNTSGGVFQDQAAGFIVKGDGSASTFISQFKTPTLLYANSNIILMRWQQYATNPAQSGNYQIRDIQFYQNFASATLPVIQLDNLGEYSVFEHCDIYQAGTGDGLRLLMFTKGTVQHCNFLNQGAGATGLGAARVGVGLNIFDAYAAGLGTVRKVTSRGWHDAFILGYGSFDLSCCSFIDCECSTVYRGITVSALNSKTLVQHCYFEGMDGGTAVIDKGRYTVVRDCIIQGGAGQTQVIGIDGSAQGGYCLYDGNEVGMPAALSSTTGISVAGSATSPATVTNNQVVWGSSGTGLSNVLGIQLSGIDAQISYHGNMYNPNAGWSGASNCLALADQTTSSSGSSGSGVRGFGNGQDSSVSFPRMSRGAIGYWKNSTNLGNAALSAGVLTLGQASYVVWNPSSGTLNVTSIAPAVCDEGHVYVLRVVNGTGNSITFTAGSNLRIGTANIVQTNGTTWTYQLFMDTNTAWIISSIQNS